MTDASPRLLDGFDALLFDLDGVVYVGPDPVPHAADVIATARAAGVRCAFVTNNASRTPDAVAAQLAELGVPAEVDEVVTSAQAAVELLPEFVPAGAAVLVCGGEGIAEALRRRGYRPVWSMDDDPAAVMQGFDRDLGWRQLAEATLAVRAGLPWIAPNLDRTFPTERGVVLGNGSLVAAVAWASGRQPDAVAGKPEPPLIASAVARTAAARPLVVGDRLDTDIEAASRTHLPSLLVFTGVTSLRELMAARADHRPTHLGADLRVLLDAYAAPTVVGEEARCGTWSARVEDGAIVASGPAGDAWQGVRTVAALAWSRADAGAEVSVLACTAALADLVGAALGR